MASIREDYIERMIERLVAALAAILKAGKQEQWEEALGLVQQTSLSLFGLEYRMLVTIDARSVADVLGHPEKLKALARLILEEARLFERRGELPLAAARRSHAGALLEEAQRRRSTPDPECEALLATLRT